MGKQKKPAELIPAQSPTYLTANMLKNSDLRVAMPFKNEIFVLQTYIAGLPYIRGIKKIAMALSEGDELKLIREPKNQYDERAVLVKTVDNKKIGYIPRRNNEVISRLMDGGIYFKAFVDRVDLNPYENNKEKPVMNIYIKIYMIV